MILYNLKKKKKKIRHDGRRFHVSYRAAVSTFGAIREDTARFATAKSQTSYFSTTTNIFSVKSLRTQQIEASEVTVFTGNKHLGLTFVNRRLQHLY